MFTDDFSWLGNGSSSSTASPTVIIIFIGILLALLVFNIITLVSILKRKKYWWILVIWCFPGIGTILWWTVGRKEETPMQAMINQCKAKGGKFIDGVCVKQ
jgi:hypothetical protein